MKTMRVILASLLFLLAGHSITSQAEDIDIYSGLGGSAGKPNVLIVFDNAANFSSSAAGSSCVIDGVATVLSGTVGGIEQCAFYNVINSLPNDVVNIGMMVYNSNNIRDINNANCGGSNGGCLVVPLTTMNATTKGTLLAWIKTWRTSGGAGDGYIKSAGEAIAATMQEAWAYYYGSTGLSGRDYAGIKPAAGCQQNFVIFIGNSFSSSGSPGDGGSSSPATALNNAPGVTAAQRALITTTHATTCGTFTFPSSNHESGGYYADEWARYMREHDLYSSITETQKITTYTIGLLGPSCQATYAATLTSMANVGGGKYFATTDYDSITQALLKILNEVQAVNSVFSSSSLPVSVNAQGTYLNQIYMGMFRPDSTGAPRWLGNLKQYEFIFDSVANTLVMGDSRGVPAISSAGTGFISPNAVSFWTCGGASTDPSRRTCSPVADPATGFWVNNQQGAGGAYDLPDGELVEKGGAAQIMRLASLTADYATDAGTATNPRKLYTYCPSGAGCNAALSHSSNAFATTNTGITASMFGASSFVLVSSIVRTGTSALVTTSGAHGYTTGNSVTISGATQSEYNVTQNITVNSATTFTITGLPDHPTTPSTGAYIASLHNSFPASIISIAVTASTTANANGCTSGTIPNINCDKVTVTVPSTAGFVAGTSSVVIAGVSPAQYSGTFTIATVPSGTTFTYNVPVTPNSPSKNAYSAQSPVPADLTNVTISVAKNGTVYTASVNNTYSVNDSVTISSCSAASKGTFIGTYTITAATATNFTYTSTSSNGAADSVTGCRVVKNVPVYSIAVGAITRASATATTATATLTSGSFATGSTVNLAKVSGTDSNETAYAPLSGNNTVTITCVGASPCTSFTFPIATVPSTTTLTTSSPTAGLAASPVTIPAGAITRAPMGTTATVAANAGFTAGNGFTSGASIDIGVSGAAVGSESAYVGTWTITCAGVLPDPCSGGFTFGPVTLTPATPATGARILAYQGATPPARDPLINWVRGQDNFGDETGPGGGVTVRPSLHGDVLHSRPVVINYGGATGVVVFYGANDGVYRAVNGNQQNPAGSTLPAPGSELWGFIPTEFFGKLDRQRTNSPQLQMELTPAGIQPAPLKKDYFADGSTGVYQLLNADGTTNTAYIYLAMRRGGRLIYALDVSNPASPQFLWKIDPTGLTTTSGFAASTDYAELGQTWSAPKVASIDGYANPVLIFGAGYDTVEDSEPPLTNTMGRGIFIVDAITGAMVWSATPQATGLATACGGTTTKAACLVAGMDYSIPADVTLMDRDVDGKIDRLYAVDVGGNVWRVDFEPTLTHKTPNYWQVNKLAALGCSTGPCSNGPPRTTPRKFFYPADVVPTANYDAVLVGQGDREHPLFKDASVSIRNRFYMLRDVNTGSDGSGATVITRTKLYNASAVTAGALTSGVNYTILTTGTTDFTAIGAASNTAGTVFTATGAGSGTGTATRNDYSINFPSSGDGTTPNLGYYISLGDGEKVVNAPLTVAGYTYFGTNQPVDPAANSCSANLGLARGYKIAPLGGGYTSSIYAGGGLPPSPVAGLVSIDVMVNGVATTKLVPFIIGGGGDASCTTADCSSALGGGKPTINVPTSRTRTYWYQEID